MRGVHKTWPERLIATVTALVLIFASAVGAHAHAAGNAHHHDHTQHHSGAAHANSHHAGLHAALHAAATDAEPAPVGDERGKADSGKGHTDCCDTTCHGGYAVLGATCVIYHSVPSAPPIVSATPGVGAQRGSLERPPRSSVLA